MTIQKIFSDTEGEERYYSVLINEAELRLFGKFDKIQAEKLMKGNPNLSMSDAIRQVRQGNQQMTGVGNVHDSINLRSNGFYDKFGEGTIHLDDHKFQKNGYESHNTYGVNRELKEQYHKNPNGVRATAEEMMDYAGGTKNSELKNQQAYRKERADKYKQRQQAQQNANAQPKPERKPVTPTTSATTPSSTPTPAPKGGKQEEIAKRSQNFISRNWNKLGTGGKIGVGVAGSALAAGAAYGAYKMMNKKKNDQDK